MKIRGSVNRELEKEHLPDSVVSDIFLPSSTCSRQQQQLCSEMTYSESVVSEQNFGSTEVTGLNWSVCSVRGRVGGGRWGSG